MMELGIYTFGELTADAAGRTISPEERIRNLVEEMELADQVGLDVFAVGEHHRPDFTVSSPAVVLAAGSARTSRIRLSSAVSVLSSDEPIRVFQQFSTLDLLSGGRAEIMAGRGSFIESFPLFGYDLADYDRLFEEKLRRLLEVRTDPAGNGVYPLPVQQPLPVWVAVGGAPESAVRAGMLGLPMAIAIIGGRPDRFAVFAELHREAARRAGHDPGSIPISINSHGFIAETSQAAADAAWPPFKYQMTKIGRERGWPPAQRQDFDAGRTLHGALFVGSPAEVTEKILYQHEIFDHDRFLLQLSVGTMPHAELLRAIELFGTEVAPAVRAALAPAPASS